jgi:hypothetical protein
MDQFITELQNSFQNHLSSLLEKKEEEINKLLMEQNDDNGIFQHICKEIDLEHELMVDLVKSELDPGEWFERKIEETTKELFPNATPEQIEEVKIEEVKDEVEKAIVEDIESETNSLEKEMSSLLDKQETPEENVMERTTESEVIGNLLKSLEDSYE